MISQRLTPCLWFDGQAEEAANYYVSIFADSRIKAITRYPSAGQEIHHQPAGSVMVVSFELDGHSFTALNGGPLFKFNEAVSLQVICKTQAQVDYYWKKLSKGGDPKAQVCGWLKDRFGLSWQVVPAMINELLLDEKSDKSQRAFAAMMDMKKIDIATLQRAYEGRAA